MRELTNRFGSGIIYEEDDLGQSILCVCTACMSVWSDFLSFAVFQKIENHKTVTSYLRKGKENPTDTIVVLGCQVTDLAIYNDLKTAEDLHNMYPDIQIYIGGCLAQRFDIELPDYIRRLDVVRKNYVELGERRRDIVKMYKDGEYTGYYVSQYNETCDMVYELIRYEKPFWNRKLNEQDDEFTTGNLFRNMYPLKIGAGCHGNCKCCTIRDTRGETYQTNILYQIDEFITHDDVVVVSDSPTIQQIKDWCYIARREEKPISFRNIEPQNANACRDELIDLAQNGLLKIFHCPIQSNDAKVLKAMNRNVDETLKYIDFAQLLRDQGTKVATNIIIDYVVDGEVIHNMDEDWLNEHFDYWSWNPYFDGQWDYDKAKERFEKYIGEYHNDWEGIEDIV